MEFALAQLFDFGIFLLVAGGVVTAVLALARDAQNETMDAPSAEPASSPTATEDEGARSVCPKWMLRKAQMRHPTWNPR